MLEIGEIILQGSSMCLMFSLLSLYQFPGLACEVVACCPRIAQPNTIRRAGTARRLCRADTEPLIHLDYHLLIRDQWFHVVLTTWREFRAIQ